MLWWWMISSRAARTVVRWGGSGGEVGLEDKGEVREKVGESLVYLGLLSAGSFFGFGLSLSFCACAGGEGGLGGRRGVGVEIAVASGCASKGVVATVGGFLALSICWTFASVSSFHALSLVFLFSALTVLLWNSSLRECRMWT